MQRDEPMRRASQQSRVRCVRSKTAKDHSQRTWQIGMGYGHYGIVSWIHGQLTRLAAPMLMGPLLTWAAVGSQTVAGQPAACAAQYWDQSMWRQKRP